MSPLPTNGLSFTYSTRAVLLLMFPRELSCCQPWWIQVPESLLLVLTTRDLTDTNGDINFDSLQPLVIKQFAMVYHYGPRKVRYFAILVYIYI